MSTSRVQRVGGGSGTFDTFDELMLMVQPFLTRGAWTAQWGVWQQSAAENSGIPTTGVSMGTIGAVTSLVPSHSPYDLTKAFRRQPRRRWTSAAGAGNNAGVRNQDVYMCGDGGWVWASRWGPSDPAAVAGARGFTGVRAATGAPANTNPSNFVDCVGFGFDAGESDLSLMHNDGSGTCTKVPLGSNFPANTIDTDLYEQILYWPRGGSLIHVGIKNIRNREDYVTSVASDIPAAATGLGTLTLRNNGATALAVEVHFGHQLLCVSLDGLDGL